MVSGIIDDYWQTHVFQAGDLIIFKCVKVEF